MRVFDRAAEIVGDERAAEMRELMWFRELLSIEQGFEFGDDGGHEEWEDLEERWAAVDPREVGQYWELNDGKALVQKQKITTKRRAVKTADGWMWKTSVGLVPVACGELYGDFNVCVCVVCKG
jgi:hypothetical protein